MPPSPSHAVTAAADAGPPGDVGPSAVLRSLARATREAPTDRKLLLAPTRGGGKELLRAMARTGTPWLGWEVLTLRPLALEIVADRLVAEGRFALDDVGEQALLDEVLDEAIADLPSGRLAELSEGVGFRSAVRGAVKALRLAGVPAGRVAGAAADPEKATLLARVLEGFEARLDAPDGEGRRPVDTAFVLREAARALADGAPTGYDRVWLVPGLSLRGLAGVLLRRLMERDAGVLEVDPVEGMEPPESTLWRTTEPASALSFLHAPGRAPEDADGEAPGAASGSARARPELFHAASVTDELREVLRRVMARGLAWDEVEIVATDAGVYGPALHALAGRMEIPVTFGVGLPVERTRAGQAVDQYVRWIEDGFPSIVIRRLVENGTLDPNRRPGGGEEEGRRGRRGGQGRDGRVPSGAALARTLRRLRIGWGRDRYLPLVNRALEALEDDDAPRRHETPEDARGRVTRERRRLRVLRGFLAAVLEAVPPVPGRIDPDPVRVSPAALARGLRTFLGFVPGTTEVERTALERLDRRLRRVEAELTRRTAFGAALTVLREQLEIRVPAPRAEGPAPWRSTGGHLYLTDVEHGGASGRRATFVVGLDAGRTGSGAVQDPILLDRERRRLGGDDLPTSLDRIREGRFRLAAVLAGLRGEVTMSYGAWDPGEARSVLPSSLILQAYRLASGRPDAGYTELHDALGDPVTAVPGPKAQPVDAADVWLGALRSASGLRRGAERVREAYPGLARGRDARAALESDEPSPHLGLVRPRPELDPRSEDTVLSASRLETLGTCPLRFFYRYVLDVKPRRDPTMDPELWLDALERGSLLHDVYEAVLRRAMDEGVDPDDDAFEALALDVLDALGREKRREIPPPSQAVHEREMEALRGDVRSFVAWVREHGLRVLELERSFGMPGDEDPPVALPVRGGSIRLRGAIDRIDERVGTLHLMDYKTGGKSRYRSTADPFLGGRRLQHLLYSRVAEILHGGPVVSFSYVLPTRRAENHVLRYSREELEGGEALLDRLIALAAGGRFLPTEEPRDCSWCDFRDVCRVRGEGWKMESPPAAWAKRRFEALEAYEELREVRTWDG